MDISDDSSATDSNPGIQTESLESENAEDSSKTRSSKRRKCRKDSSEITAEYNFRRSSMVNRVQSERKRLEPKQPKPKIKPPPLSKYRRKAANGRERGRMIEINDAFQSLKNVLPDIEACPSSKMTKIMTLRLALNYISALRQSLGYEDDLNSEAGSTGSSSISSGDEDVCQSPVESTEDFLSSEDIAAGNLELDDLELPSLLLS